VYNHKTPQKDTKVANKGKRKRLSDINKMYTVTSLCNLVNCTNYVDDRLGVY